MDNLELLERLGTVDPPDLSVSARVAASIEDAIAGEADGLVFPVTEAGGSTVAFDSTDAGWTVGLPVAPVRRLRRVTLVAAAVAAIAVAVVLVVPAINSPSRRAPSVSHPTVPTSHPQKTSQFQLVDSTSFPFHVFGGGANAVQLDCPTTSVCYAWPSGPVPANERGRLEKSTDGGASWQPTAVVPGKTQLMMLTDSSCASADVCALVAPGASSAVDDFAFTTDGGAQWADITVPLPPSIPGASLDAVTCIDGMRCVAHVQAANSSSAVRTFGTFLSTDDGGVTWTAASSVPATASDAIRELRCAPDGSCIAITVIGSAAAPAGNDLSLQGLRSTDFGATWTVTPAPSSVHPGSGVLLVSCGDTLHCLAAYPSGTTTMSVEIASTSDGGATWKVRAAPSGWGDIAIAVSCDSDGDCWVASSNSGARGGYVDPVVSVTHDGGEAWAAVGVPSDFNGVASAVIGSLSCPSAAGCVGIGVNQRAFLPPPIGTPPAQAFEDSRVILSNITGSPGVSS